MNYKEWDKGTLPLNRIFDLRKSFEENSITTAMDSGRKLAVKKNTCVKNKYSFTYAATKEQAEWFEKWYKQLGGENIPFWCRDLQTINSTKPLEKKQLYRITAVPSIVGQNDKEISMEWAEV